MGNTSSTRTTESSWLIRISKNFEQLSETIIDGLNATLKKRLGDEYYLVHLPNPDTLFFGHASNYIRWKLPLDHTWPCNPEKMDGFIEKAAQTVAKKFSKQVLQGIFIGRLDPSSTRTYYKSLATNLRGRTLHLFEDQLPNFREVEDQAPNQPSLYALVGKEGLFCGVASPFETNGFYPGGTKFISQKAPHTISRAGAKIAEALHYLKLHRPLPKAGSQWLELGACPGGMTSELLERGYRVTAVDRAPLDGRLDKRAGLSFIKADVAKYSPNRGESFDALLCDMNGDSAFSFEQVVRLARYLKPRGLIIFTLKTSGAANYSETNALFQTTLQTAHQAGLILLATTHLTYNRHEFTLFLEPKGSRQRSVT
jgi:23S rRNA (cytidine2498-2'-O)-methyltransferase